MLPFGSAAAQESYRTITLSEGETRTIVLDDGESFENVLIDQRADDCHLRINTDGNVDDFTVRNVGFLGVPQGERHVMNLAGNGIVENVFMDGRRRNGVDGTKMGGIRMKRGHSGRIEIRHTFIAGMGNNASYASSAGKNGGGNGAVIYENCYHRDNTVSNYRPGTEGSRIRNSVSIANGDCLRGPYPHSGVRGCRGAWVKHWPDQRIENCAFYMDPDDCNPNETIEARHFGKSDGPGVEVTVVDTGVNTDAATMFNERSEDDGYARINTENVHDNPTVDVLQDGGIPLNPEMAASGQRAMPPAIDEFVPPGGMEPNGEVSNASPTDTSSTTLTIDGTDAGWTDYQFTVDGDLFENPSAGSLGTGDSIDGSSAQGFVNGGIDGYRFSGTITEFSIDGDAAVRVDGQEVDPSTLGEPGPTVTTEGASDLTETTATLNGSLNELGGADSADVSFEWRETGAASWNGTDAETLTTAGSFSHSLTGLSAGTEYEFRAVADASDGDSTSASPVGFTTGSADTLDRTLTMDGTDAGWTDYQFTVSGDIEENPDAGSLGTGDSIDGSSAQGFVNGGIDGYRFSGEIADATVEGDAAVRVDGQEVDPSTLGGSSGDAQLPKKVVIDGTDTTRTDYAFTIDGEVQKGTASESDDAVSADGTIEGVVRDGVDSYVYSGTVTGFSVDGGAEIRFEDND